MSPFILVTTLLTHTFMLMAPVSAQDNQDSCPPGRYRTETNICCQLCPPGTAKVEDCSFEEHFPVCLSCSDGSTFTDSANNLTSCQGCRICDEQRELVQHKCFATGDTVCECVEGMYRPSHSEPCEVLKGSLNWIWVVVFIIFAALGGVAVFVYWFKKVKTSQHAGSHATDSERQPLSSDDRSEPTQSEPQVEVAVVRDAVEMIQEKMASGGGAVWTWLSDRCSELLGSGGGGVGPHLLLDLFLRELIDEAEYWKARGLPDASRLAHYVIALVVDRGEEACGKFRDIYEDFSSRKRTFLDMQSQAEICSPTYDPNTANGFLLLSTDLKTVTKAADQLYPHHMERFESVPQVLCSEGFSSGRHYWELHVGCAEQYMVGVACGKNAMEREECIAGLDGVRLSWCVWRREAELVAAHNGEVTVLNPPVPPQRIGIHLDCGNLKLTFVCAETMTPLHDFYLEEWKRSVTLRPAVLLLSGSITIAQPLSGDVNKSVHQKVYEYEAGLTPVRNEMVALLRRRPYLFLHEMLMQGHIEAHIYWKAYMENISIKCEKFIREEVESVKKDGELEEVMEATRSNERDFLAMLKSSERCSPTVNPNSVNSDLRLSVDLRTVTLSSERHSYPHHLERFENSAQALCREGFSSGAHYWEVDVGGAEQFRVGVACATLPRGGSAEAQLLGAGADSWCLWRREGGYAASHRGRHTALAAVRPPPRKIGVHLRWEEGLLSFYCADTRRRLHSFNATASPGPLYPALCVHKGTVTILRKSLRFEEGEGATVEMEESGGVKGGVVEGVGVNSDTSKNVELHSNVVENRGEKSGGEKSGVEESGVEKSGVEKSGLVESVVVKSVVEKSGGVKSGVEKSGGEKSGVEKSGGVKSGVEESGGVKSGVEKTGGEKSGGEKSGVEEGGASQIEVGDGGTGGGAAGESEASNGVTQISSGAGGGTMSGAESDATKLGDVNIGLGTIEGEKSEVKVDGGGGKSGLEESGVLHNESEDGGTGVNGAGQSGDVEKHTVTTGSGGEKSKGKKERSIGSKLKGIKMAVIKREGMKRKVDGAVNNDKSENVDVDCKVGDNERDERDVEVGGGGMEGGGAGESADADKKSEATGRDGVVIIGRLTSLSGESESGGVNSEVDESGEVNIDGVDGGEKSGVEESGVSQIEVGGGGMGGNCAGEVKETVRSGGGDVENEGRVQTIMGAVYRYFTGASSEVGEVEVKESDAGNGAGEKKSGKEV
ncbi:uncharacterized protein LOC133359403 [Lethenteron reissneri]|uniref:uncharacterized protein LOC133359403 n=1 Tax=Lethenteron reissneri TaxID=7753 RepID=UPI002AB60F42|nr:uncharacterized protein LOC133359403 [Lethenteron reissneri]